MSIFHFLEWYVTVVYRPREASFDSWCIHHSKSYTAAQLLCITEYFISQTLFGEKLSRSVNIPWSMLTLGICFASLYIRVLAMITAGKNFNHRVQYIQEEEHEVIKHGIYKYLRHPSYFGWFYWSVGGQLYLQNVFCSVAFFYFCVKFFSGRIPSEEMALSSEYPNEYEEYAKKTPILIPFVKDYVSKGIDIKRI